MRCFAQKLAQTGLQGHLRWRAAVRFKPRLEIAHTDRVLYFGLLDHLSPEIKRELIAKLADSLEASSKKKSRSLKELFSALVSVKSVGDF